MFVGAFFVCLFVFMMQFTWRYIDQLVGKGLTLDILAQFFWYMALTLIPQALPLSVLLASLITFGNMGESLELLSMKAAGVPLVRIMRPILWIVIALCGVSFYFQNFTAPEAQMNLRTLLISMKQTQPAVEIPEGVFYSGVPNVNLYVQQKNAETGMLRQVIIYKTDQGFDRAQIVLADSARMEMTADKLHLKLTMWDGEQFENLQSQGFSNFSSTSVPYDRETFKYKEFLIDFDSNFNMLDKDMLANQPSVKNMVQIQESVDSINLYLDSLTSVYYTEARRDYFTLQQIPKQDSIKLVQRLSKDVGDFDKMLKQLKPETKAQAVSQAGYQVRMIEQTLDWKQLSVKDNERLVRRHWAEWHQKMSISLSCLFFFFIGAPLGGIIRKGGLGMPTVISVGIFIIYYIINVSGMKLAIEDRINMALGMWLSTIVLMPCGIYLTYKSNKDAVVFNIDAFLMALRRWFGVREPRNMSRKEVIIQGPDYDIVRDKLSKVITEANTYDRLQRLKYPPRYSHLFFRINNEERMQQLSKDLDVVVEQLANSRDANLFSYLNKLPSIYVRGHKQPFETPMFNVVVGICLPIGLILWFRAMRFRLRLHRDLRLIVKVCRQIVTRLPKSEAMDYPKAEVEGTV